MSEPNVCPKTLLRCASPEVCWLARCVKDGVYGRPIRERDLSQEEKYRLAMSEKEKA